MNFVCSQCGKVESADTRQPKCSCGGLWDLEASFPKFSLDQIDRDEWSMFRYRKFMAVGDEWKSISLGEGMTPIVRLDENVLLKMDYFMPTLSYKDRGAAVLMAHCKKIGVDSVVQDSSGNAGNSIAAYAAKAGIHCEIFVPEGTSPKKIDMILDGGTVEIGVESTILDMTVTPPMLLRPGAVTKEMLEELIGPIAVDAASISADSSKPPKAPGMKYRHYAPKADLSIVEGPVELVIEAINGMAAERIAQGYKVGIIGTEESRDRYRQGIVKSIGTREDEATIASHLYAILREFDHEEVDYIYSESFARGGIGNAIMNRLLKAAGHHVINI